MIRRINYFSTINLETLKRYIFSEQYVFGLKKFGFDPFSGISTISKNIFEE